MNAVRSSPERPNDLVEGVRLTGPLLIFWSLPRGVADHLFDVLGYLIVHVRHETPSKDHQGSLAILAGMCLTCGLLQQSGGLPQECHVADRQHGFICVGA